MNSGHAQLPLRLSHPPQLGRDSFVVAESNRAALTALEHWPLWADPVMVLSGPPGSGKTHLAHIWAERAGADVVRAEELGGQPARILSGRGGLAVDGVPATGISETPLFHLINAAKESRASLLLTARAPAGEWAVALADLRSRLRLATCITLARPDDQLLRQVMVKLFADRQLVIEKPVLDYLLTRTQRSLAAVARLVDALDQQALAAGRRITRPLASQVLANFTARESPFAVPQ
jgi:chromosomal replication initiation ATPase DnaA